MESLMRNMNTPEILTFIKNSQKLRAILRRIFLISVPAILLAWLNFYVITHRNDAVFDARALPGKPLAAYEDVYPVRVDANGALTLDKDRFNKAVNLLSNKESPRAISDLLYLGSSNHVLLWLDAVTKKKYTELSEQAKFANLKDANRHRDDVLQPYKDIVNGVGQTFAGTAIEIVLHDTRDPLHSIIAVQNSITGRRVGDANTNFGVQLIKNYSTPEANANPFISYELRTKDGRRVKSSTIPIFHPTYGLVAFICLNIDLSKIDKKSSETFDRFVEGLVRVTPNEAIDEMIETAKIRK
jgi:YheO-like PAS domain